MAWRGSNPRDDRGHSQCAEQEHAADHQLPRAGHLQPPHMHHGDQEHGDVGKRGRERRRDEDGSLADARGGDGPIPLPPDRIALEHPHEDGGEPPGRDDGAEEVQNDDGAAADEEPSVQEQDGEFNGQQSRPEGGHVREQDLPAM